MCEDYRRKLCEKVIVCCTECNNCDANTYGAYVLDANCERTERKLGPVKWGSFLPIPDWCPLPDTVDKEE